MKLRILSHLAAFGIGIAVAVTAVGHSGKTAPDNLSAENRSRTNTTSAAPRIPRAQKKVDRPAGRKLDSEDFQQAWDDLASRKFSRGERIPIQREILEKWAEVDLQGAVDAAMKEAWGGGNRFVGTAAFKQVFADRPMDAWALIQSGRYGVGAQKLRDQWLASVMEKDKLLVASMLTEFPGRMGDRAVPELVRGVQFDPASHAILARIIAQAGNDHDDWLEAAFKELPTSGDPVALREQWSTMPEGIDRKLAMMRWSVSLRGLEADELIAELANIPADARGEITKAMVPQLKEGSSALLPALEFALTSDEWKSVAKSAAAQLASFADLRQTDTLKLAEWGTRLPERPDTVEIYQNAVGRYIREDLPRAREWLELMPEGSWKRENGLAEFSQQALFWKADRESSQWALDSISDPAVKAEATKLRQQWELQTTWRKK